jgi:hypothetical protein
VGSSSFTAKGGVEPRLIFFESLERVVAGVVEESSLFNTNPSPAGGGARLLADPMISKLVSFFCAAAATPAAVR